MKKMRRGGISLVADHDVPVIKVVPLAEGESDAGGGEFSLLAAA